MARSELNYEVHVQQKGRWEIHARYTNSGRDRAIEEAKVLDQLAYIESVRVVRESYDPDEGMSIETIVYQSSRGRGASRAGGASQGGAPLSEDFFAEEDCYVDEDSSFTLKGKTALWPKRKKPKEKKAPQPTSTFGTALIKIILILLISTTIAVLVTLVGLIIIKDLPVFRLNSSNSVKTIILITMFLAAFLATAIPMTKSFLAKVNLAEGGKRNPLGGGFPGGALKTPNIEAPPAQAAPEPTEDATPPPADRDNEAGISEEAMEAAEATEKALEDWKKEKEKEDAEKEIQEEAPDSSIVLSPHGEKQKAYLMRFLGNGLEKMPDASRKLDNFNKFGVNLFLSGACEILGQKRNLDALSTQAILCESVQVMGFKKEDAKRFAEKYEEYLLNDSRYMQMFQAGRNAMNSYFTDETASAKHMEHAMVEWNKPKQKEETVGPITVMFTDMVGSTALTQSRGDAVAQEVVRAHNRIVREALTRFGGKEVKHTGDGIMASFSTTSNSVEAGVLIQKEVEKHNLKNSDLPLHIKIGINAGEPIAEDNDLFGTTVQLAARIVDKAQSEEVFVSEIVRGICAGKDIKFTNRGPYTMKGFADDLTLYEVVWKKKAED